METRRILTTSLANTILKSISDGNFNEENVRYFMSKDAWLYDQAVSSNTDLEILDLINQIKAGKVCTHLKASEKDNLIACLSAQAFIERNSVPAYQEFREINHENSNLIALPIHKFVDLLVTKDLMLDELQGPNLLLSERLDLAYEIYCRNGIDDSLKNYTEGLLKQILNIRPPKDKAAQETTHDKIADHMAKKHNEKPEKDKTVQEIIHEKMADRIAKKHLDPEYIPGKNPSTSTHTPDSLADKRANGPPTTAAQIRSEQNVHRLRRLVQTVVADKNKTILTLDAAHINKDVTHQTIMLNPELRDAHRVVLTEGAFKVRRYDNSFQPVNTSQMKSHDKTGFAAFTLNRDGELSLFEHNNMADRYAHSSMNAGQPVIAAGEVEIKDGKLVTITSHSGHYRPDAESIYATLKYFKSQGVDISNVTIALWKQVPGLNETTSTDSRISHFKAIYNSESFYKHFARIEASSMLQGEADKLRAVIKGLSQSNSPDFNNTMQSLIRKLPDDDTLRVVAISSAQQELVAALSSHPEALNGLIDVMEQERKELADYGADAKTLSSFDALIQKTRNIGGLTGADAEVKIYHLIRDVNEANRLRIDTHEQAGKRHKALIGDIIKLQGAFNFAGDTQAAQYMGNYLNNFVNAKGPLGKITSEASIVVQNGLVSLGQRLIDQMEADKKRLIDAGIDTSVIAPLIKEINRMKEILNDNKMKMEDKIQFMLTISSGAKAFVTNVEPTIVAAKSIAPDEMMNLLHGKLLELHKAGSNPPGDPRADLMRNLAEDLLSTPDQELPREIKITIAKLQIELPKYRESLASQMTLKVNELIACGADSNLTSDLYLPVVRMKNADDKTEITKQMDRILKEYNAFQKLYSNIKRDIDKRVADTSDSLDRLLELSKKDKDQTLASKIGELFQAIHQKYVKPLTAEQIGDFTYEVPVKVERILTEHSYLLISQIENDKQKLLASGVAPNSDEIKLLDNNISRLRNTIFTGLDLANYEEMMKIANESREIYVKLSKPASTAAVVSNTNDVSAKSSPVADQRHDSSTTSLSSSSANTSSTVRSESVARNSTASMAALLAKPDSDSIDLSNVKKGIQPKDVTKATYEPATTRGLERAEAAEDKSKQQEPANKEVPVTRITVLSSKS